MARPDRLGDAIQIDLELGHQNRVCARRDPGVGGDPTLCAAHHLDNHDPVVRLGRRREPVERLGRDRDGRVEAERHVRPGDVVVDRLRDADDSEPLLLERECRAERSVTADHDDGVDSVRLDGASDARVAVAVDIRVAARRPEDGAAALQDPPYVVATERAHVPVHEPLPAVDDAHDLHAVGHRRPHHDRTDDGVESGAVAAGSENAYHHAGELNTGTSAYRPHVAPWAGTARRRRAPRCRRAVRLRGWR